MTDEERKLKKQEYDKKYAQENNFKSQKNYMKEHLKSVHLKFNITTDASILEKLDSVPNKTDYIRQLILRDIDGNK